MKLKKLEEAYDLLLESKHLVEYAIHFRRATHGTKDESNTHPFILEKNKVHLEQTNDSKAPILMHNGVFDIDDPAKIKSDTRLFAERLIQCTANSTKPILRDKHETVTKGNRLIVMHADKPTEFVGNRHKDSNGRLQSNTGLDCPFKYHYEADYTATTYMSNAELLKKFNELPYQDRIAILRESETLAYLIEEEFYGESYATTGTEVHALNVDTMVYERVTEEKAEYSKDRQERITKSSK